MVATRKLKMADLFCGAGGSTTGAVRSGFFDVDLAVNHWQVAVRSHDLNHPSTRHICAEIDSVNPREFRDRGIYLLWASPECVGHSNAKGDAPVDDQRRVTAWCVPRWLQELMPQFCVIENVREFRNWGPLIPKRDKKTGKILKDKKGRTRMHIDPKRKGETYRAFIAAIVSLGYQVEERLLNAADYGGAQKRVRLFIMCRRGKARRPFPWPAVTHTPERWRTARNDVIDWSIKSKSIFFRKRELSDKTIRRIEIGVRKFGKKPEPFVTPNFGERDGQEPRTHDVDKPLPVVTSRGAGNLIEPFVVNNMGKSDAAAIDQPIPAVTGTRKMGVAEPFLVDRNWQENRDGRNRVHGIDEPLTTVTGQNAQGIVEPFVVDLAHSKDTNGRASSADAPMPTLTTCRSHAIAEPFLLPRQGLFDCQKDKPAQSVDQPLNTVTASHKPGAIVEPFVVNAQGPGWSDPKFDGVKSVDEPLPTQLGRINHAVVDPFIVQYRGGTDPKRDGTEPGRMTSIDQPLPTVDTNPRYALCEPFQFQLIGRGSGRAISVDLPVPAVIAARKTHGLVEPQLAFSFPYYGTGVPHSIDEPIGTVTTVDRFALITAWYGQRLTGLREHYAHRPVMLSLIDAMEEYDIADLHYRMFVNKELQRAQGFGDEYLIFGTDEEATKQIGNAVHTDVAEAICRAIGEYSQPKPRGPRKRRKSA